MELELEKEVKAFPAVILVEIGQNLASVQGVEERRKKRKRRPNGFSNGKIMIAFFLLNTRLLGLIRWPH